MVICTRNPCTLWICDLWSCEFLVHANTPSQAWHLDTLLCLASLLQPQSVQYFFLLHFFLWVLSWIPLLLGEMSPVLRPILRDLRYIKQRMVVGSPQKEKKNPSGNYLSDLLGFLMILETRTIQFLNYGSLYFCLRLSIYIIHLRIAPEYMCLKIVEWLSLMISVILKSCMFNNFLLG